MTEFAIAWPTMFGINPAAPFALFESKATTLPAANWAPAPRKSLQPQMEAVAAPVFFGPLTTRVGTVVFGNVTKRLYHRYFCTTRNW